MTCDLRHFASRNGARPVLTGVDDDWDFDDLDDDQWLAAATSPQEVAISLQVVLMLVAVERYLAEWGEQR